jgi:ATP-dependent Clp protease ATP-binding subunit ClpC
MFEKYSEKASRVIYFSRREAGEAGAIAIDTVHLLLGLLREDEDRFKRLTGVPNLSIIVRGRLEAPLRNEYRVPESVDIPIATEYREVLLQAADEARMLSCTNIEPEHLLLAILRMKECLAANILVSIGLTYDALQEAIADERGRS